MSLLPECPRAPDWRIDWDRIERAYAWLDPLRGCSQEPEHHAEGDVWTHTRLACETLVATAAWRALPESERAVLFAATLLHDIGKPAATRRESDGRNSSRGHSGRGEIMARRILWRLGAPFRLREQVAALVRHH
jgi:hypothetical protein